MPKNRNSFSHYFHADFRPNIARNLHVDQIRTISPGYMSRALLFTFPHCKGPLKLIKWIKIAHSFLQSLSNLFHFIILSLPI